MLKVSFGLEVCMYPCDSHSDTYQDTWCAILDFDTGFLCLAKLRQEIDPYGQVSSLHGSSSAIGVCKCVSIGSKL